MKADFLKSIAGYFGKFNTDPDDVIIFTPNEIVYYGLHKIVSVCGDFGVKGSFSVDVKDFLSVLKGFDAENEVEIELVKSGARFKSVRRSTTISIKQYSYNRSEIFSANPKKYSKLDELSDLNLLLENQIVMLDVTNPMFGVLFLGDKVAMTDRHSVVYCPTTLKDVTRLSIAMYNDYLCPMYTSCKVDTENNKMYGYREFLFEEKKYTINGVYSVSEIVETDNFSVVKSVNNVIQKFENLDYSVVFKVSRELVDVVNYASNFKDISKLTLKFTEGLIDITGGCETVKIEENCLLEGEFYSECDMHISVKMAQYFFKEGRSISYHFDKNAPSIFCEDGNLKFLGVTMSDK